MARSSKSVFGPEPYLSMLICPSIIPIPTNKLAENRKIIIPACFLFDFIPLEYSAFVVSNSGVEGGAFDAASDQGGATTVGHGSCEAWLGCSYSGGEFS